MKKKKIPDIIFPEDMRNLLQQYYWEGRGLKVLRNCFPKTAMRWIWIMKLPFKFVTLVWRFTQSCADAALWGAQDGISPGDLWLARGNSNETKQRKLLQSAQTKLKKKKHYKVLHSVLALILSFFSHNARFCYCCGVLKSTCQRSVIIGAPAVLCLLKFKLFFCDVDFRSNTNNCQLFSLQTSL